MFTRSCRALCNRVASATASSTHPAASSTHSAPATGASFAAKPAPSAPPVSAERIREIFASRRTPTNIYTPEMRSGTLSDHPVTLKVARDEISYRRRKLVERGDYESAAEEDVARETIEQGNTKRDNGKTHDANSNDINEYRYIISALAAGYITAHFVVYRWYYPEDMRLSYDPKRGYIDDIENKNRDLEVMDAMIQKRVLEAVYDAGRANAKDRVARMV
eukprot:Tbor_TRINITY_DN5773_c1_g1::TRINITY_DN5773_c1_g1_i1::g.20520::m.20520